MTLRTRLTIAMVALVFLTAVLLVVVTTRTIELALLSRALNRVESHVTQLANVLETHVHGGRDDVKILRNANALADVMRARANGGNDPNLGLSENYWRRRIAERYVVELGLKPNYRQLLLITADGREYVRVDRSGPDGAVRIVPTGELQDKAIPNYFSATMQRPDGGIYISPIDLNKEHGSVEAERIPVLRIATPIFGADGVPFGIVMITIDMRPALEQLRTAAESAGSVYVVNDRGDYLINPDRSREFNFEFNKRARLQDDFPALGSMIGVAGRESRFVVNAAGENFGAAVMSVQLAGGPWLAIVETAPYSAIVAPAIAARNSILGAGVIAVLGAIIVGAVMARSLAQPLEQMTAAVNAFGRDEWMTVPTNAGGEIGVLARAFEAVAKEARDKTAALQQESEERGRVVVALRDSLARQETIFASPLVGILTLNGSGSIESLNPQAERIFGCRSEAVVRRDIGRLIEAASDGEIGSGARLRQLVTQDGEPRESVGRHSDGSSFPIEFVLAEMQISARAMFVMFVRNISQRKRNERLKDDFVATVSHELRTPLTSIAGSLGLLVGGATGKLPASAGRLLSIAYSNSQRLVRLINDILDIEKIESGKATFDLQPADLRPLIEQAIEANRGFADNYGARIRLDPASVNGVVRADVDRLTQVVTNLLSNAVKFSPAGAQVDVSIENNGEAVRVSVLDHGPGIPEEFKARIFEKFAQADASDARQKGGTGLGLNIVKQIINQHGGSVAFDTAPGGGTIFYFELPRFVGRLPDAAEAHLAAVEPRLMLCDDDPEVSSSLANFLSQAGFVVDVAPTAADALARAAGTAYDGFLIDLALPDLDGISLLQQLRANPRHADTPTVVISADPERGRADLRSSTLNVLDWLNKPVDLGHLVRVVSRAVAGSGGGRPRILHVDDDRDVLHVVSETLRADADIVSVDSIDEARAALAQGEFDLAVLDLALADGFGLDLLSELHKQNGTTVPVVVFSAQDANPVVAARVEAMLTKSRASIDKLVGILRRIIAQKASRTRVEQERSRAAAVPSKEVA